MQDTVQYQLKTPIQYQTGGENATATQVTLKAPFSNVRQQTTKLKQMFFRAVKFHEQTRKDIESATAAGKKKDLTGDEILAMMHMSDVDMTEFTAVFQQLLTQPGVCLVDGKENLTVPLYNRLSDEDADKITGEYLANFIISSLMKSLENSTTG